MTDIVLPTISLHEILTMVHILGVAFGLGGATISDVIFFRSTQDGVIQKREWDILQKVSLVVWSGLVLAIISGIGFLLSMDDISNPKIWAKMTIIGVIFLNGIFLHWKVFPVFESIIGKPLNNKRFVNSMSKVFTSGAISFTSWYLAFIMGAWRGLNNTLTYEQMILAYLVILSFAILVSNIIGRMHAKKIITIHIEHPTKEMTKAEQRLEMQKRKKNFDV